MNYSSELKELNMLYKELADLYHNYALHHGISDSVFLVYYGIYILGDGCMQRDICKFGAIRKQTVNSAVQKLAAEGCLELRAGHGRDRHLYLTEKGRKIMQSTAALLADAEQRTFDSMGAEHAGALLSLTKQYLETFIANADAIK